MATYLTRQNAIIKENWYMSERNKELEQDFNPELDLKLERIIDLPREWIYEAWTTPASIKEWFCPKPWGVSHCEVDLKPGGLFRAVMLSPEGEEIPNMGCYLEIVPNERIIWTDALLPGYRPAPEPVSGANLYFTGMILLSETQEGTKYLAISKHRNKEDCKKHEEMGFHQGWGIVLDQLIEYVRSIKK